LVYVAFVVDVFSPSWGWRVSESKHLDLVTDALTRPLATWKDNKSPPATTSRS